MNLTESHNESNILLSCDQMKKKPFKKKPIGNEPINVSDMADEVDFNLPDYKTVIVFNSKDQLNITLTNCGLSMLSNLGKVRSLKNRFHLFHRRYSWLELF